MDERARSTSQKTRSKQSTKAPATKGRKKSQSSREAPQPKPEIPEEVLDRVIVLLVTVRSQTEVLRTCQEHQKLKLTKEQAEDAIAEALRRIRLAAALDYDAELGAAKTRLIATYQKVSQVQDFKTALATQKELNKLLGLYPKPMVQSETTAADAERDEILTELADAREQLAKLVRAGDDVPMHDVVRRVVALFVQRPTPDFPGKNR